MHSDLRTLREQLRALNLKLRQAAELAEAQVEPVNQLIRSLATTRLVNDNILLGRILGQRAYNADFDSASGQVIQAALSVRNGIGVIYWDSEEFVELQRHPNIEAEALLHHVAFEDCEIAMKALLLPEIGPLLDAYLAALGSA